MRTPEKITLDPVKHARLLADADAICHTAGIPRWRLETSAVGVLSEPELNWLKNYRAFASQGRGYVLVGEPGEIGPESKFAALTAAFLRNFIDCRTIPLSGVLAPIGGESDSDAPDCTVLCIPNFYVCHHGGKQFPAWKLQQLHDYLVSRYNAGKVTVLYVQDWQAMQQEYGLTIGRHITEHYIRIPT